MNSAQAAASKRSRNQSSASLKSRSSARLDEAESCKGATSNRSIGSEFPKRLGNEKVTEGSCKAFTKGVEKSVAVEALVPLERRSVLLDATVMLLCVAVIVNATWMFAWTYVAASVGVQQSSFCSVPRTTPACMTRERDSYEDVNGHCRRLLTSKERVPWQFAHDYCRLAGGSLPASRADALLARSYASVATLEDGKIWIEPARNSLSQLQLLPPKLNVNVCAIVALHGALYAVEMQDCAAKFHFACVNAKHSASLAAI